MPCTGNIARPRPPHVVRPPPECAPVIDALRAEIARYQARVGELEADFLALQALPGADLAGVDAEVKKAWLTAAAFKKRCAARAFAHAAYSGAGSEDRERGRSATPRSAQALPLYCMQLAGGGACCLLCVPLSAVPNCAYPRETHPYPT